jgi:hypothetical protein
MGSILDHGGEESIENTPGIYCANADDFTAA